MDGETRLISLLEVGHLMHESTPSRAARAEVSDAGDAGVGDGEETGGGVHGRAHSGYRWHDG